MIYQNHLEFIKNVKRKNNNFQETAVARLFCSNFSSAISAEPMSMIVWEDWGGMDIVPVSPGPSHSPTPSLLTVLSWNTVFLLSYQFTPADKPSWIPVKCLGSTGRYLNGSVSKLFPQTVPVNTPDISLWVLCLAEYRVVCLCVSLPDQENRMYK